MFQFLVPQELQRIVLASHPVVRDEAQVTEYLENLLRYPAYSFGAPYNLALRESDLKFEANPDISSAKAFPLQDARRYQGSQLLIIGMRVMDSDGEVVFQNNADGQVNPVGPLKTTDRIRVLMIQSMYNNQWYV